MPTLRVEQIEGRTPGKNARRSAARLALLAVVLLAAGCANTGEWRWPWQWRWPPYGLRERPPGTCDATKASALVGQKPTEALLQQARSDSGAQVVRVIRHDQMVTKEFQADRLDLRLDANGAIAEVTCG